VIGDPLAEPVPLHRPGGASGVRDQPGHLLAAPLVLGGLVTAEPGTARRVADLEVDGPAGGGAVG
jgi:hypothetical protein